MGSGGTGSGGTGGTGGTGGSAGEGSGGAAGDGLGGAGGIPVCCGVDQACPRGTSCQGTPDYLDGNAGTCEPTPTDGGCWNDLDCPTDGLCMGGTQCACDAYCTLPPAPGTCTSMGEPCCLTDDECTDSLICVGADVFTKGRCESAPTGNECYTTEDCDVGRCVDAAVCVCGENCASRLGVCVSSSG